MKVINFGYQPEEIMNFYSYSYEWIDDLNFFHVINKNEYKDYIEYASIKFREKGWEGDGEINLIWIPPFSVGAIISGGVDMYLKKYCGPNEFGNINVTCWTKGLIFWHVKQKSDGISFILSPIALNIPNYGLE